MHYIYILCLHNIYKLNALAGSRGGQVSAQVEIHLAPGDGAEHELGAEHAELGAEHVRHEVDVLLARDHDVRHAAAAVQLLHLLRALPPPGLNPG